MFDAKFWLTAGLALWNVALTIAIWLRKPGEDAGEAVASLTTKHAEEMAALNTEIGVLTERMKHMPTDDEIGQLNAKVESIRATLQTIPRMQVQLDRMETYLLNNK